MQPTPQYGHTVSVTVCRDSSHVPAARMSCSLLNISAPVGHTPMQLPQYTQAESGSPTSDSFAIGVAGRGFDAHISTEFDVGLPDSACVYCGNCIGVCPTGALMFKSEHDMRAAGTWDESEQAVTETVCPYCGVGCMLELHVQDNSIVKVTSPLDHSVTAGHLCVKGRFGFQFVQKRAKE